MDSVISSTSTQSSTSGSSPASIQSETPTVTVSSSQDLDQIQASTPMPVHTRASSSAGMAQPSTQSIASLRHQLRGLFDSDQSLLNGLSRARLAIYDTAQLEDLTSVADPEPVPNQDHQERLYKLWSGQGLSEAQAHPTGYMQSQTINHRRALQGFVDTGYPDPNRIPRDPSYQTELMGHLEGMPAEERAELLAEDGGAALLKRFKEDPTIKPHEYQSAVKDSQGYENVGWHAAHYFSIWEAISQSTAEHAVQSMDSIMSLGLETHSNPSASVQVYLEIPTILRETKALAKVVNDLTDRHLKMADALEAKGFISQAQRLRESADLMVDGIATFEKGASALSFPGDPDVRRTSANSMKRGRETFFKGIDNAMDTLDHLDQVLKPRRIRSRL